MTQYPDFADVSFGTALLYFLRKCINVKKPIYRFYSSFNRFIYMEALSIIGWRNLNKDNLF